MAGAGHQFALLSSISTMVPSDRPSGPIRQLPRRPVPTGQPLPKMRKIGQIRPVQVLTGTQNAMKAARDQADASVDKESNFHLNNSQHSNLATSSAFARTNQNQGLVRANLGQLPVLGQQFWDASLSSSDFARNQNQGLVGANLGQMPAMSPKELKAPEPTSEPKSVPDSKGEEKQSEGPLKISYDFELKIDDSGSHHHLWLPHCRFNCFGAYVSIQLDFLRQLMVRELHESVKLVSWYHPSFASWQKICSWDKAIPVMITRNMYFEIKLLISDYRSPAIRVQGSVGTKKKRYQCPNFREMLTKIAEYADHHQRTRSHIITEKVVDISRKCYENYREIQKTSRQWGIDLTDPQYDDVRVSMTGLRTIMERRNKANPSSGDAHSQGRTHNSSQGLTHTGSQGLSSQGRSHNSNQGLSRNGSQGLSQGLSHTGSQLQSQGLSHNGSQGLSHNSSQGRSSQHSQGLTHSNAQALEQHTQNSLLMMGAAQVHAQKRKR